MQVMTSTNILDIKDSPTPPPKAAEIFGIFNEKNGDAPHHWDASPVGYYDMATYALFRSSMRAVLLLMMSAICFVYSQLLLAYPRHWSIE